MNTKDDVEMKDANADLKQITEKIDSVNLQPKTSMIYSGNNKFNQLIKNTRRLY
jgi:hypothetical protein